MDGNDVSEASQKISEVRYRFKSSWFQRWPWLHYLENTDSVLSYYCAKAHALKLACSQRGDLAFISTGYHNWKAATDSKKGFAKHERSAYHKMAIEATVLSNRCTDIGELLSDSHRAEKDVNKRMLLHTLSTVRFLARQGLAYRGHIDDNSNFKELLRLRCEDVPDMREWLLKKTDKYVSHDIQNEMIELMGHTILHQVINAARKSDFYSIMVDETRDISN